MTLIAVCGDVATTTAVGLASAWSGNSVVVEADPAGGDLAAWLDLPVEPSLSTLVARMATPSWATASGYVRTSASGINVITCPVNATEARQAVREAGPALFNVLAHAPAAVVCDVGTLTVGTHSHPAIACAQHVVVTHRQSTQSPAAAAVRLHRLTEQIAALAAGMANIVVAVVGDTPFGRDEVRALVQSVHDDVDVASIAVDQLCAATYGGRQGVSERKARRLPLHRDCVKLAELLSVGRADSMVGL